MPGLGPDIARRLERHWREPTWLSNLLLPLSWLYRGLVRGRALLYRSGLRRIERLPVPVIVVGNIAVGGTGKTPLACWLAALLAQAGYRPGIVCRGYGGRARRWPRRVTPATDPEEVGDEPVLVARRTACPVAAGPDRPAAARLLVAEAGCTIIVADDGLQHLALGRDLEIATIDGVLRFGNGRCLPAGPLRESRARLASVDARVCTGEPQAGEFAMRLEGETLHRVRDPSVARPAARFRAGRVHAVAGIGHPERFFAHLRRLGLDVIEHAYADHHRYRRDDICFSDPALVVMTEKDAVKCRAFADERHWYLPVEARPDPALGRLVLKRLQERRHGQEAA